MSTSARTPVQIAWVTRDLDATETALTALLGARKWVRIPDVHFGPDVCTLRGEPADFVANISLSYAGDMQLELIEPVRGDSIYAEFVDGPGPGLHHVCVHADDPEDFAAVVAGATATGADVVMQGVMPGGMRFAYLAAPEAGVPFVEVAYVPDGVKAFFDHIRQEQG
jgi:catechol 2,3-dioxygenase-like lactoylglutathione lyase family enzyme